MYRYLRGLQVPSTPPRPAKFVLLDARRWALRERLREQRALDTRAA